MLTFIFAILWQESSFMAEVVELLWFIALKSLSRTLFYKALNEKAACIVRFLRVYCDFFSIT